MSELLREIQEDMRAERMQAWWKRFGSLAVWVSVAVVAGTAAGVGWRSHLQNAYERDTAQLIRAQETFSTGDAAASVEAYQSFSYMQGSAHFVLSRLGLIRALLEEDKTAEAQAVMQSVQWSGYSKDARALAGLVALYGSIAADPALAEGTPFAVPARESRAWTLVAEGKAGEARPLFTAIRDDETAPASLRERARLALQGLPAEAP
jgi:hypothetical protein